MKQFRLTSNVELRDAVRWNTNSFGNGEWMVESFSDKYMYTSIQGKVVIVHTFVKLNHDERSERFHSSCDSHKKIDCINHAAEKDRSKGWNIKLLEMSHNCNGAICLQSSSQNEITFSS